MEAVIRQRFGAHGLRVFRLLLLHPQLEQKQIAEKAMLPPKVSLPAWWPEKGTPCPSLKPPLASQCMAHVLDCHVAYFCGFSIFPIQVGVGSGLRAELTSEQPNHSL